MIIPDPVESDQEIIISSVSKLVLVGENVSFDGIRDFFIKHLSMLVDDQSVSISVQLFETEGRGLLLVYLVHGGSQYAQTPLYLTLIHI